MSDTQTRFVMGDTRTYFALTAPNLFDRRPQDVWLWVYADVERPWFQLARDSHWSGEDGEPPLVGGPDLWVLPDMSNRRRVPVGNAAIWIEVGDYRAASWYEDEIDDEYNGMDGYSDE